MLWTGTLPDTFLKERSCSEDAPPAHRPPARQHGGPRADPRPAEHTVVQAAGAAQRGPPGPRGLLHHPGLHLARGPHGGPGLAVLLLLLLLQAHQGSPDLRHQPAYSAPGAGLQRPGSRPTAPREPAYRRRAED